MSVPKIAVCGSILPRLTPQHRPSPDDPPVVVNDTQNRRRDGTSALTRPLYLPVSLSRPAAHLCTATPGRPPAHRREGDDKSMDSELPFGYARREKVPPPRSSLRSSPLPSSTRACKG